MKETKQLEFKEDNTKSYCKTVSAFANYEGGKIIFGVTDDGKIKGIQNPDSFCLNIENAINDNLNPVPDFMLSVNGNTVELDVKPGQFKPYYYRNKAYKRNDTSTVEVDRLELNQLILEGKNVSYDETSAADQNLTFEVLEKKLQEVLKTDGFDKNVLKSLGLISTDGMFNKAAEMLADENILSGIDIVKFGNSIDEIYERITLEKTSVLKMIETAGSVFQKYYLYEKIDGGQRSVVERIPVKAFREAIANAVVHRNWSINANIQISMFEDYVEVVSPGGLVSGITEEEFLQGKFSILRNPVLADVLYRLKIIEKFGTGIKRIRNSYAGFESQPEFSVTQNSISVKLPVCDRKIYLTELEKELVSKLQNDRLYSRQELEEATGFNKDKVIRIVNSLASKGKAVRIDEGRNCRYLIKL